MHKYYIPEMFKTLQYLLKWNAWVLQSIFIVLIQGCWTTLLNIVNNKIWIGMVMITLSTSLMVGALGICIFPVNNKKSFEKQEMHLYSLVLSRKKFLSYQFMEKL